MLIDRRRFSGLLAGMLGGSAVGRLSATPSELTEQRGADPCQLPPVIAALRPLPHAPSGISTAERAMRVERARELMREAQLDALLIEPGTTMSYFSGVSWGLSERPFLEILPARGEPIWIAPGFEESRARELVGNRSEVRVWQEDESPYALAAQALRDRGVATGRVGVEERLRFFIADGIRREARGMELVGAESVTAGCRMIKSPAEIALMQHATDITIAAFRAAFTTMKVGMLNTEMVETMQTAMARLGGTKTWTLALFGKASAIPHGTIEPQRLTEGDVVLVDSGCDVGGYQSDVTRTTVFGTPSARQISVWQIERAAQDAAFAAAQVGATCDAVDAAARKVITDAGFGPGYQLPGTPHRTGHGIGMDGHEWTNFVRGNMTKLRPGMCFSNEPTIAIPGEFGIRLEDCLYITESGPRFFVPQSEAIDRPV